MSDQLAQINNAAHQGAFGHNPRSEPTLAQLAAGNYKKGVVMVKGLSIAIENPAYTYRKGMDKSGKEWMCLMQAHYGYIQGHKGNDGDEMDVFIGNVPENDTVYIVNQKTADGYFDEHKIMLGFLSQQQAVDTYQHCFERGWTGLMSVVPCTMTQFKWWLANGDKSRPVTLDRLPYAGLERLDSVIWGGNDGSDLASHSGQVHKLLYQIRQCDDTHQALEPLSYNDLVQELGNQGFMYENYDALVVEYNKLEKKAKQLLMVMQGAASTVKPMGVTVGKPLTKGGVANVVAWFEMDDGQAVGVFFHNPDKTPKKIDPTDEMISYKWVLNKKDITIAVAPEQGKDLVIRTVAKRIMLLVEQNHDRFVKANGDKAALNQAEQDLTAQVAEKQATLKSLQGEVAVLQAKKAEKEANKVPTAEELTKQGFDGIATELKKLGWTDDLVMGGLTKSFVGAKESGSVNEDGVLNVNVSRENGLIRAQVGADTLIPNSVDNIPQYGLNAQTEQSYKKVADKVNNAVDAYVEQRKVELAINGKSTLSANQSTDYGFTFIKDDFDKNKYRLLDADGKEYQVIWKSGSTWTMMTGETFKTLAEAKQAAIDHALDRKETERQEKASRAEVDGMRTVKRKPVSVFVYWSESSLFTDNTSYPFAEFEALAFAAAMKNTEGGYDKTKVKVTFDDGFVYGDIRVDLNTKETGFKSLVKSTLDSYKAKNIVNEDQQQLSTFDFSGVNPVVPVQSTIEPVAQVVEPTPQDRHTDGQDNEIERIASLYAAALGHPVSKRSREFASDILSKNAYGLEFIANGMNDKGKKVFSEVTGVSLPKQQGATWKAIRDWAGVSDEQENYRIAVRDVAYETKAFMRENNVSQEMADKNKALIASKIAEGFDNVEKIGNNYWFTDGKGQGINLSEKPKKGYLGLSKSRALVEAMIAESKAKKQLDSTANQSIDSEQKNTAIEPTTQDRPSNWRTNLANARAVAKSLGLETKGKKLERLVMDIDKAEALPNRDELDPTKLAELGVATITSIGHAENIYIEKDGKQYFSKVGNPQLYALGEWDFAKYPEGKPAAPVTQPEPTPVNRFGELSNLLSSDGWSLTGIEPKEDGDILATKPFSIDRKGQKINATFSLRYKSNGNYFQGYVDEIGDTNNHKSAIESSLMLTDDAEGKVKAISENLAMFAIRNSAKTKPEQPVSEPPMANPDRDYLQSIIDGEVDPLTIDFDALITLAEKYEGDADMNPIVDQALEVINQAQQSASKGI